MPEYFTPNKFLEIIEDKYAEGDINDEQLQYLYNLYEEHYLDNYNDYTKGNMNAIENLEMVMSEFEQIVGPLSNVISK